MDNIWKIFDSPSMIKLALEAGLALALEAALTEVDACAVIVARFRGALVHDESAVGVSVTLPTLALITSDIIDAHFVIGTHYAYAVINVHVAHLESEFVYRISYASRSTSNNVLLFNYTSRARAR